MNNSPKNLTRFTLIPLSLTLALTLPGMSGHTARIQPTKEVACNSTPRNETCDIPRSAGRSPNNVTVANDAAIKPTSVGRTYYWRPESGGVDQPQWIPTKDAAGFVRNHWVDINGVRGGVGDGPGSGDTAIIDSGFAGQFRDYVYLDQNITIDTLIMRGPHDPSQALYATLQSTPSGPHTLTVTHRFEWIEGRIIDGATVEAAENSVVTISGGSLGDNTDSNGFLTINGTGSISGPFKIEKGGTLTVGPNAMLTIDTASPVIVDSNSTLASTLEILGRATITGTGGVAVTTLGAIKVSGTLDLHTDAALSSNCDCAMTVNAGGTLVKSAGNGISSIGLIVNNAGTVSANAGTLAFSRGLSQSAGATILNGGNLSLAPSPFHLNGGILAGKGTVTGSVNNAINASVSPGYPQAPGQLTIAGDYTQAGKLEIDIGGTTEGQFDKIIVNAASLSGTLDVRLINNFHPACNDSFDIVKHSPGQDQGQFSTVNGIDLGNGRNFAIDYQSDDVVKIAAQGFAGPDPDNDGVSDACDNCPNTSNNDQANSDHDREGDVCDDDDDNDGVIDSEDDLPFDPTEQIDTDHDDTGDNADTDDDNDCFPDLDDVAPNDPTRSFNPVTVEATRWPQIVFSSRRDGNWDIYGMMADGTQVRRLTTHPSYDTHPALSPDRRTIAFMSNRTGDTEIYLIDAAAGETAGVTPLTNNFVTDQTPAWAPDGKRIVFTNALYGRNRIYSIRVGECRGETCSIPEATRLNDQAGIKPDWSRNGCNIVFAGRASNGMHVIFSMDHDGRNLRTLTSVIGQKYHNIHPTWSPDGNRIAFIRQFTNLNMIYTMKADGSDVRVLPLGASVSESAWGIDGIIFRRHSNQELYRVTSNGSGWTRLTINEVFDSWPDW